VLVGDVVVLRRVLGNVAEFPVISVKVGQRLGRNRRAERLARLDERWTRPRAHRAPPAGSIERWPNISKYWIRCRVGAAGSSKVWAKLTPLIGAWTTP
jgi:hypothetical protein